jgi:hypothetical protein
VSLPPLAVAIVWIAVILGMTAAFVVFAHKWRQRRMREGAATASDLLAEFHEIRSRGEISEQEYQRIKQRLSSEVKRELSEEHAANSGDPAQVLKATARRLLANHQPTSDNARTDEGETNGAAGGAAREGCDATPPNGGDSTEERR